METIDFNLERIRTLLGEMGGVAIGYSGGCDSTLLAAVAGEAGIVRYAYWPLRRPIPN